MDSQQIKKILGLAAHKDPSVKGTVMEFTKGFAHLAFSEFGKGAADIMLFVAHPSSSCLHLTEHLLVGKLRSFEAKWKLMSTHKKNTIFNDLFITPRASASAATPLSESLSPNIPYISSNSHNTSVPTSFKPLSSSAATEEPLSKLLSERLVKRKMGTEIVQLKNESHLLNKRLKFVEAEKEALQTELERSSSTHQLLLNKSMKQSSELDVLRSEKNSIVRNSTKKIDRRERTIAELVNDRNELRTTCAELSKSLRKDINNEKQKFNRMKQQYVVQEMTNKEIQQENVQLKDDLDELRETNAYFEKGTVPPFATKLKGQYVDSVRITCMQMATKHHVSLRKVSGIIKLVLKNMVGVEIKDLPSKSTIENLFREANAIAKTHCQEKLLEDYDIHDQTGNVSHSDAGGDYHRHFQTNEVCLRKHLYLVLLLGTI